MINALPARYSSTVQLQLIVGGVAFGLSQIGPSHIVLDKPQDLPPGDAEVVMYIDGHPRTWLVRLLHGAVPYDRTVEIEDRI